MIEQPWRLVAVVVFLGALAGGIVVAMRPPPAAPRSATTTGDATTAATTSAATTTAPATTATTTTATAAPAGDLRSATIPSLATTTPPPAALAVVELEEIAVAALDAWGVFAVTGNIAVVADAFDPAGPQYGILLEEAETLAAEPIGLPGYTFAMRATTLERPRPQRVVLTGPVTMTRPGEVDQQFSWRVHLRWSGTEWRLWTIDEG